MVIDHPLRWCVVHTGFRQEKIARDTIARLGLQPFLLMHRYKTIRKKRLSIKQRRDPANISISERPMFARYVFAHIDVSAAPWKALFSTAGIDAVVMDGSLPARCPDDVIAKLQAHDGVIMPMRTMLHREAGSRVLPDPHRPAGN